MKKNIKILKPNNNHPILLLIEQKVVLFVVFITGACVLVIEVVANRILAPYFGSTIYSVSSIISVVLAALSFGYYLGGKYADANPQIHLFYRIIFFSGLSTIILEILVLTVLPRTAYLLHPIYGPLIASIFLFSLPSFLLGMLSPFAIKLQEIKLPKIGVGKLSGEIFFASTFGSIFGSLLTGFYLIPNFGIRAIITAVGILLTLLGFCGWFFSDVKKNITFKNKRLIAAFLVSSLLISILTAYKEISNPNTRYIKDGVYEQIVVYDSYYKGKPARLLAQDAGYSSGIYLDSKELAFEYTKYYVLYKLFKTEIKNALFLGAGAYTTPNALIKELPEAEIDVVEIEPTLFEISQKYFSVTADKRLTNIIKDGRRYLSETDKRYDLIFGDAYTTIYSLPVHMTTMEFFQIVESRLNENGIFLVNIIGDLGRDKNSLILSEIKTFLEVFPNSYFFAVENPAIVTPQNTIFVGYKGKNRLDLTDGYLKSFNNEIITNLRSRLIDLRRFDLSNYKVLTDNYAPIESLAANVLKKNNSVSRDVNAAQSFLLVEQLTNYGSRYLGSNAHSKTKEMIVSELRALTDMVMIQSTTFEGKGENYLLENIIAKINPGAERRIILASHYDSKKYANRDKKNPTQPVPGANDSASGIALLIELTRFIRLNGINSNFGYDFVFFDGEEGDPNATLSKWKPLGSNYFADNVKNIYPDKLPELAVIIDMVCDKNLNIYMDRNSVSIGQPYVEKFFDTAAKLYPNNFSKSVMVSVEDDHVPLARAGIPSFLIIDFDYPYFHTTKDTLDKCSKESLGKVGNSILEFLKSLN